LVRTAPRVAKEQRSGGPELENQTSGFKFWLRERPFDLETGS
jgi:hypothetical protein